MELYMKVVVAFRFVVMSVGIPGNLLVITVYARKRRKTSTDMFILALAVSDLCGCFSLTLLMYRYFVFASYTSAGLCKFTKIITLMSTFVSMFLTNCITLDRYLAICHPLKRYMTAQRALIAIAICMVVTMGISFIGILSSGIVRNDFDGGSYCIFNANYAEVIVAYSWLILALYFASLINIITMYTCIYRALRRQIRRFHSWSSRNSSCNKDSRVTCLVGAEQPNQSGNTDANKNEKRRPSKSSLLSRRKSSVYTVSNREEIPASVGSKYLSKNDVGSTSNEAEPPSTDTPTNLMDVKADPQNEPLPNVLGLQAGVTEVEVPLPSVASLPVLDMALTAAAPSPTNDDSSKKLDGQWVATSTSKPYENADDLDRTTSALQSVQYHKDFSRRASTSNLPEIAEQGCDRLHSASSQQSRKDKSRRASTSTLSDITEQGGHQRATSISLVQVELESSRRSMSMASKSSDIAEEGHERRASVLTQTGHEEITRRASTSTEKSKERQKTSNKTNKMIFLVTVIYFVTWIPLLVFQCFPWSMLMALYERSEIGYALVIMITNFLHINNAINPIVYSFVNVRYRNESKATLIWLRELFRRKRS